MADHIIRSDYETPACILPVPLHPARYRERGFNQSIEIGKTLSRQLQVPLELNACSRIKNSEHQIGSSANQRSKNIKKAFALNKPLNYKSVAILDDVMTTGSTVSELAKTLKREGLEKVDVWICARA